VHSLVRFSGLVRKGLLFRNKFEDAKRTVSTQEFDWYPYDCFVNLFYLQKLLNITGLTLKAITDGKPVLDLGTADGALSFFLESLGYEVDSWDYSGTNVNRMMGVRTLAEFFGSQVRIIDIDLDGRFDIGRQYGFTLLLGTLYHLKKPFYLLETLAKHARFCILSTRVARYSVDRSVRLDKIPVAYLLDSKQCNDDATNYWIFSAPGLSLLVRRAGWRICASAHSGATTSDPTSDRRDERMFLLLESAVEDHLTS
jgi:tRNA (mo5U34)-methyltransferase